MSNPTTSNPTTDEKTPGSVMTALDRILVEHIERARQEAIRETIARLTGMGHEWPDGLRSAVATYVTHLVETDEEVRSRIRAACLAALDRKTPGRW